MGEPFDVQMSEHTGPLLSFLAGWGLLLLAVMACVFFLDRVLRCGRQARRERDAFRPTPRLAVGKATLVGTVEYEEGASNAVEVEIVQEATEKENSGNYSHRWTEVQRTVRVRPFFVRLASEERVRVEPTKDVFLVDDMDRAIFYRKKRRARVAELVEGERVIAQGVLARGDAGKGGSVYRSGRQDWVLRPPRLGRIALSTHPLEMRFLRWRKFYGKCLLWAFAFIAGATALCLGYYEKSLVGQSAVASVENKRHYTSSCNEGSTCHHYELTSRTPWGTVIQKDIDREDWDPRFKGDKVYVLFAPRVREATIQYGTRPTLGIVRWLTVTLGFAFLTIIFFLSRKRYRAWFEGRVVDRDSGRIDRDTGLNDPL